MTTDHSDSRWVCAQCADYDYLNSDGLCSTCAPERMAEFVEVAIRALCGESGRRWRECGPLNEYY